MYWDTCVYLWPRGSPICSRCYQNARASSTAPNETSILLLLSNRFLCDRQLASHPDESFIGAWKLRRHCHPGIATSDVRVSHNRHSQNSPYYRFTRTISVQRISDLESKYQLHREVSVNLHHVKLTPNHDWK